LIVQVAAESSATFLSVFSYAEIVAVSSAAAYTTPDIVKINVNVISRLNNFFILFIHLTPFSLYAYNNTTNKNVAQ